MRKMLFIRKLKVNVNTTTLNLGCVFMIAFLMCACAGTKKMQTSSSEYQTIECKRIAPTGSRLKKKICKTKAQWAREAGAGNKTAGDLQKNTDRSSSLAVPQGDAMGGMSVGVPR